MSQAGHVDIQSNYRPTVGIAFTVIRDNLFLWIADICFRLHIMYVTHTN